MGKKLLVIMLPPNSHEEIVARSIF